MRFFIAYIDYIESASMKMIIFLSLGLVAIVALLLVIALIAMRMRKRGCNLQMTLASFSETEMADIKESEEQDRPPPVAPRYQFPKIIE